MKKFKWVDKYALNFVKKKRPSISPNKGFLTQLQSYSERLTNEEEKTDIWETPKFGGVNSNDISCIIESDV